MKIIFITISLVSILFISSIGIAQESCSGTISLKLEPAITKPSTTTTYYATATISGLQNCNGKIFIVNNTNRQSNIIKANEVTPVIYTGQTQAVTEAIKSLGSNLISIIYYDRSTEDNIPVWRHYFVDRESTLETLVNGEIYAIKVSKDLVWNYGSPITFWGIINESINVLYRSPSGIPLYTFKTPSTEGKFTYEAKIDKNGDGKFDQGEKATKKIVVSATAPPLCKISDVKKVSNFEYGKNAKYAFITSFYNLPEGLGEVSLDCIGNGGKEIIELSQSVMRLLECDYSSATIPTEFNISVSGEGLPTCKTEVTDFLPPMTDAIRLLPGWNLISPPRTEFSTSDCKVTANIFRYDAINKQYFVTESIDKMTWGEAYWVKVKEECSIVFSGDLSPYTIVYAPSLVSDPGKWNMVGASRGKEFTVSELNEKLSVDGCSISADIFGFNPITKNFMVVDKILPGYGYWMKVKSTNSMNCPFY